MRAWKIMGVNQPSRRGQVLLVVPFVLVAMLAMLGLVTDLGYARFVRWKAQAAADAAAVAATEAALAAFGQTDNITCGSTAVCQSETACPNPVPANPANNLGNGCLYAQQNGFTAGGHGGSQNVTMASGITTAAPTAPGVSVSYWVTVRVSERVPQLFSSVFGNTSAHVAARATGAIVGNPGGSCIFVLDPSVSNAFGASGGSVVNASCGIYVDSSNWQAMAVSGGTQVTASTVSVVGSYSLSGGSTITPAPKTGANSVPDPYAGIAPPTYGPCDYTNWSVSGGSQAALPGVYCNGIKISAGATVTFNPGVYILRGGGLQVSGGSTISGTGVTFYNTADGYTYKPINISGGGHVNLAAPTSGPLAGMLFFQDRSINSPTANALSGGSSDQFTGILYFPTTPLNYSGGSSTDRTYTTIVARTVNFSGGSTYIQNYAIMQGGLNVRQAALVE
jgi:Putative Flp pilus-assembly TadE/G-like